MKILAGRFKGRALPFKPRLQLRPTSDKVRQAIINTLREPLAGARVLDAFSGTGLLGLEALSCGAASVVFVEKHKSSAGDIQKALKAFGLEKAGEVLAQDACLAVKKLRDAGRVFEIVFADPPYEAGFYGTFLAALDRASILAPGGWLVLESRSSEDLPERTETLTRRRIASYGDTAIHYYFRP